MALRLARSSSITPGELDLAYDSFIRELVSRPMWFLDKREGTRIPWWALEAARTQFNEELSSPGVYIFGARDVPMYIGQTGGRLLVRLRNRYTRGEYAQFQLARMFGELLIAEGYEALPDYVLEWYMANHKKSRVRLRHAAEFAKVGISSVWIALVPTTDGTEAKKLERRLIPIAVEWNRRHALPDLLNAQYAKD